MFKIHALSALQDNYIWVIHDDRGAVIVDPGEAKPVQDFLHRHGLALHAILCTHRHRDHTGGIAELRGVYNVPVYGRQHPENPHLTHFLHEGDRLPLSGLGLTIEVLEVPGHLDDHLAYFGAGMLFCGDILFGAGCGKNFEGSVARLQHSIERLAALPDDTLIYSAHEYTAYNLPFAALCEPDNRAIRERIRNTEALLAAGRPTVPFTLALEKATNPFLRCHSPELIATLRRRGLPCATTAETFASLRRWRDSF